jgi:hypothetical protein
MDKSIPTITICDPDKPGDYLIINATDFNHEKHILWEERFVETSTPIRNLALSDTVLDERASSKEISHRRGRGRPRKPKALTGGEQWLQ